MPSVLDPSPLDSFFAPRGAVARALPGYFPRPQQLQAADAVETAMKQGEQIAVIEAGTGVGKTLAYLVPALLHARPDRKVVISTHTLALQAQLWERDLPLALSLHNKKLKAALLKGRGNYLCLQEMNAARGDLWVAGDAQFSAILNWSGETETGDLAELDFNYPHWGDIQAHPDTCKGPECRYFDDCFYYKAKRMAEDASIILVNHALFFADLAVRRSEPEAHLLPDYSFAVFDEAHHLENTAARAFGIAFASSRLPILAARIRRGSRGLDIEEERLRSIERESDYLFEPFLRYDRPEFFVADVLGDHIADAREQTALISAHLEALALQLRRIDTNGNPVLKDRIDGLGRQTVRTREELTSLFHLEDANYMRWGSVASTGRSKTPSATLYWTPISVAPILEETLWRAPRRAGAALISATLSTNGGFGFIKQRLGLIPPSPSFRKEGLGEVGLDDIGLDTALLSERPPLSNEERVGAREGTGVREEPKEADTPILELELDSPFDYEKNCLLYLPRHLPAPNESLDYKQDMTAEILQLLDASQGGAFLLFTSHRVLRQVYDALCEKNLPYPLLRQGEMPGGRLVTAFRELGNAVLFGTQSFWEGVDVPGEALRLVIVDRLPFGAPDSPLQKARVDAVTKAGGDWFKEFALPQAQLRLKQGFGRLIRTSTDRGVVAILDSRLVHKYYGTQFLKYLPPAKRTYKIEDVAKFYAAAPQAKE